MAGWLDLSASRQRWSAGRSASCDDEVAPRLTRNYLYNLKLKHLDEAARHHYPYMLIIYLRLAALNAHTSIRKVVI